ncbi:hypothetical protein PHYBOEH_006921 [Phytophthora boehmeriae]|uniref:Uncharacterized protein n=1 Tax=Phytophthora boehmeriae TaxID=109152 RepID=A0A8T1WFI4_9STRA|nr:hypothetical protein PHYBOEH_006921 [Phytophthora boehmeriae]
MKLSSIVGCIVVLSPLPTASGVFPQSVASLIDSSVDPCEDFYQFSCGGWLQNHEIPVEQTMVEYSFDMAQDEMDGVILESVANDSTSLIGALFASCMDMDARNAIGSGPLQDGVESIINAKNKQELFQVAGRLARTGADFITSFSPDSSLQNSSVNILWVSHADLTLNDAYYQNPQVLQNVEENLSTYASTILNFTGFGLEGSEYDDYGEVVLGVEKQMIELQSYSSMDPVSTDVYYLFKYQEAAENYPLVFGAYAEGMQLLDDAPALTKDTDVALLSIAYFEKAEELVMLLSLDALKTYVAFAYINGFAKYLSEPFLTARYEFFRATILGADSPRRMDTVCASYLSDLLPVHTGAQYVAQRGGMNATGEAFVAMVDEILDAMTVNIEKLDWLDEMTRASVLKKLDALEIMYVQPDSKQLDKEAEGLTKLDPTAFFANVDLIKTAQFVSLTWSIGADVDREEWGMSSASVNAYYTPYTNQVVFPAGIMQQPFFDASNAAAQIFGSVGVVVGHEISHGFDDTGANFDAKGNWNAWWTEATVVEFGNRAQCLVDQYSGLYTVAEDGKQLVPVDGKKTLGENIADNGGLHVAFDAYRNRVAASADNDSDQLFFLSYAQTWCGKVRDETAANSFLTNTHAIGEVRVNGAAMNSAAFAAAFNCPANATMNPIDNTSRKSSSSMSLPTEQFEDDDDRERRQRYEETERELLAVLEAEPTDPSTRRRQLVGLFDRFRSDYTQLSVKLRESLRLQRRLMDKCLQMKNELVVCAIKIKTTEQVQADEIKSLSFYRDECEHAWKQSALSQARERDAMRIIDDLRAKMEDLQLQVKTLIASGATAPVTRRRPQSEGSNERRLGSPILLSPKVQASWTDESHTKSNAMSPSTRMRPQLNSSQESFAMPPLLSFDEWKSETKVWSPGTPLALGGAPRQALTPSKDFLHAAERQQEISRCVSVPSLQPTPMERVSSPQQKQRPKVSTPTNGVRPATPPIANSPVQTSQNSPIVRRGGTPAIKRQAPRQLPHVQ